MGDIEKTTGRMALQRKYEGYEAYETNEGLTAYNRGYLAGQSNRTAQLADARAEIKRLREALERAVSDMDVADLYVGTSEWQKAVDRALDALQPPKENINASLLDEFS